MFSRLVPLRTIVNDCASDPIDRRKSGRQRCVKMLVIARSRASAGGMDTFIARHRSAVLLLSAVVPLAVSLALSPFRASIASTNAALVLVLIVVAAAATGLRFAGMVAAVSSAVSFDFFLTAPYYRLA